MNGKHSLCALVLAVLLTGAPLPPSAAQLISYPDPHLNFIYPAGGQQGQTVAVELGGLNGLRDANGIIVDGPPGITVSEVKAVNIGLVRAVFKIAPDAPPGRRLVRVAGGGNGLTNFRYFFVGRLSEQGEQEPNNTPSAAQAVVLPVVVNGRLDADLDVDCFRFQAKAGQRIVAAMLAHGMDSYVGTRGSGFLDTSLELLDDQGKLLATAEDTLGLDPVLEYTVKADGRYVVRIQSLGQKGSPMAVYRLTLGEVPYPTHVYPAGGQRGKQVEVEFGGCNIAPGTRQQVTAPAEGSFPLRHVPLENAGAGGPDLPFLRGDFPEAVESEPNNERTNAGRLDLPMTVNGRFDRAGDQDWYRIRLKKGQGVLLEVTAQRHLRSPVDTLLEVYDAAGKKLAENDDGPLFARPNACAHDFSSADSWLPFTAPQEGDYLIRLSEQSGAGGPQAIYRLTASELKPDFVLYQWPDAVPIWGPGTTAAFVVEVQQWGGLKSDLHLRVEGLPEGWTGSSSIVPAASLTPPPLGQKAFLTITAPADASVGTFVSFRVVGRAEQDGTTIEHEAQYLTLYGNSHNDGMHLRWSPVARAVVANPMDSWLETSVKELTAAPGDTVAIPVKVHRASSSKAQIGIVVNGQTQAAGSSWRAPLVLKPDQDEILLPLTISKERRPGTYGIVVSRSWASDLRVGRPGPCTPIIRLHVRPAEAARQEK